MTKGKRLRGMGWKLGTWSEAVVVMGVAVVRERKKKSVR